MPPKQDYNASPSNIPLMKSNRPFGWLISAIVVLAAAALLFPFYS